MDFNHFRGIYRKTIESIWRGGEIPSKCHVYEVRGKWMNINHGVFLARIGYKLKLFIHITP